MSRVKNIFTVDLEEWFVVEILSGRYSLDSWNKLPTTVERNTLKLLGLLEKYNVKATWFVLGWVAEKYPSLIRTVYETGHEVACHSYRHARVNTLTPDEFREDTSRAIDVLTRATGHQPFGYRAPSWSVDRSSSWAFEILSDLGFYYDSSVFPIKHDIYGWADGPTDAFVMRLPNANKLHVLPASTYSIMGKNIPIGGGGYFRHSPYWYTSNIIKQQNKKGKAVMFYIHPWEVDNNLPQIEGLSTLQKFRTYSSTSLLLHKIEKLLQDFEFTSVIDHLGLFQKNRIGF